MNERAAIMRYGVSTAKWIWNYILLPHILGIVMLIGLLVVIAGTPLWVTNVVFTVFGAIAAWLIIKFVWYLLNVMKEDVG